MILNGQEVGEPGAGYKGFSGEDGRTTIFDYWCMPEFAKWVNKHKYDGLDLSQEQRSLRRFLSDLCQLCQDPSVRGSGYWGLKYFNRPSCFSDCPNDLYSFARYEPFSSRLLIVVANFSGQLTCPGKIRIPKELAAAAHLNQDLTVRQLLDESGKLDKKIASTTRDAISDYGFDVSLASQVSHVFAVE